MCDGKMTWMGPYLVEVFHVYYGMSCRVLCDVVCDTMRTVVFYELLSLLWYSDIILCYVMRCSTGYAVCHCIL